MGTALEALIVQDEIAHGLPLPSRGYPGDVCVDIPVAERTVIPALSGADVRTGLHVVPPTGYYLRVVGKGSSARVGFFFTLEVIDPLYRGEIILHPWNASTHDVVVERGQCIAQLELVKIHAFEWKEVELSHLNPTDRGKGRMDSTKTGVAPVQVLTSDMHPPPFYVNDRAWSPDRKEKRDYLFKMVNRAEWQQHEVEKETLVGLRALIEECESAVHHNPASIEGRSIVEQSRLLQGLLHTWFRATKKGAI